MRRIFILVICCFVNFPIVAQDEPMSAVQKIEKALKNGKINSVEALNLKAALLAGELPAAYEGDLPVKCGFGIASQLAAAGLMKPQKRASAFLYNHTFTAGGHQKTFRIHYDTTGSNKVPNADLNANSMPDWIEETGAAFERSYRKEVDTMGYKEPLDFVQNGGYDVFIENLGNFYGVTDPANFNGNPVTSTITIENDFSGGFYTHGYDALRVTCAHEFHHACQLAYTNSYTQHHWDGDGWFYEMSATWMEDVVYDQVNDYYGYLSQFFNSPQLSLFSDNFFGYPVVHFLHMLEKKYGYGPLRKAWELLPSSSDAVSALNSALTGQTPSSMSKSFSDFAIWDNFTKGRSDESVFFPEGRSYPKVSLNNLPLIDQELSSSLPSLAARNYQLVVVDSGSWQVSLNSDFRDKFDFITIEYRQPLKRFITNYGAAQSAVIDNLLPGDSLIVVVANKYANQNDVDAQNVLTQYPYHLTFTAVNSVSDLRVLSDFRIYPSPINRSRGDRGYFRFRLRQVSDVEFEVFSISGKKIARREFKNMEPGVYENNETLSWNGQDLDGHDVPSGIYVYRLTADDVQIMGKIAVVR